MDNRRDSFRPSPPMVGGSSMLVIFAVLCLTVFALLSLSTVRANVRLEEASVRAVSGYYDADCRAEAILARLRSGERPACVAVDHDLYTYSCPISDTQALSVEVRLVEGTYTILRWQAISTAEWQPDDSLTVWNGETAPIT